MSKQLGRLSFGLILPMCVLFISQTLLATFLWWGTFKTDQRSNKRNFSNERVMVTGGAGYIGSHAALLLLQKGYKVTIVDNLSRGSQKSLDTLSTLYGNRLQVVKADLGDEHAVEAVFRASPWFSAVFHFAANAFAGESILKPELYKSNITKNTHILALAAKRFGVGKFIFSSTCAVYGQPDVLPVTENTPTKPTSPYGVSKLDAENLLKVLATSSFSVRILRYFNVIGANGLSLVGENPRSDLRRFGRLWTACVDTALGLQSHITIRGQTFPLPSPDGTPVRDYVHVEDLVSAHYMVMRGVEHRNLKGKGANNNNVLSHSLLILLLCCCVDND